MTTRPILLVLLLLLPLSSAQATSGDLEELRTMVLSLSQQVGNLNQRVQTLEQEKASQAEEIAAYKTHARQSDWTENLAFKGDFRYRYDDYDDARRDRDRSRDRIRARAHVTATLDEVTKVGIGIASGDEDPISTNQTLGSLASSKDLRLDLAWFQWEVAEDMLWKGGKIENPVHRAGGHFLLWDADLRPEGMGLVYDEQRLHTTAGYYHLESDNQVDERDDVAYLAFQADYNFALGENTSLLLGAGYYDFPTGGKVLGIASELGRNSTDDSGAYLYDYEEVEAMAELHTSIADLPLTMFVDYVQNLDADEEDTAYALGLRLGKVKKQGSWKLAYTWQETDADALLGVLTDSDFADGGTDSRGHVFNGGYAFTDAIHLSVTWFATEYGKATYGQYDDFDRLFIDLNFKY